MKEISIKNRDNYKLEALKYLDLGIKHVNVKNFILELKLYLSRIKFKQQIKNICRKILQNKIIRGEKDKNNKHKANQRIDI